MTSKFTVAIRDIAVLFELKTLLIFEKGKACILHLSQSCLWSPKGASVKGCLQRVRKPKTWLKLHLCGGEAKQEDMGLEHGPWKRQVANTEADIRLRLITPNHTPAPFIWSNCSSDPKCPGAAPMPRNKHPALKCSSSWQKNGARASAPDSCYSDGARQRAYRVASSGTPP